MTLILGALVVSILVLIAAAILAILVNTWMKYKDDTP